MKSNENIDLKYKHESPLLNLDVPNIIDYCYKLDENEVPSKYRLQNINILIHGYTQNVCNFTFEGLGAQSPLLASVHLKIK